MTDLQTLFSRAVTLHQQGQLSEAKKLYLEVHQAVPENLNVLANIAIVYRDLGEFVLAESYCRKTIESAPTDPDQHLNLGAVLEAKGDSDGASSCYRKALDLAPHHPKAHNNLGKILHQQGNFDEGLEHLEKAVQLEPNYPLALNNLGVLYSEQGDLTGGKRCLEQSVTLDPTNINALYNLAGIYNGLNETEKARQTLAQLLDLEPNHQAASHMMSALSGNTTPMAPRHYVEETFDKYACRFDAHIQDKLGYDAPTALGVLLKKRRDDLLSILPFTSALDLGCGTGLSGKPFREMTKLLTGVDISSKMLEIAKSKKLYDNVIQEDIVRFLESSETEFDFFILADVLVYLGELEILFPLISQRSMDGSVIACSIERNTDTKTYTLLHSGRYGHNPSYLLNCARENGFELLAHEAHNIRKENNQWLDGDIYLLKKE